MAASDPQEWRMSVELRMAALEKSTSDAERDIEKMSNRADVFFEEYGGILREMLEAKARRQKFFADAVQRLAVLGIWSAVTFLAYSAVQAVRAYLKS